MFQVNDTALEIHWCRQVFFQSKTEKQATRRVNAIYNTYIHLDMKDTGKLLMETSMLMYQRILEGEGLGQ